MMSSRKQRGSAVFEPIERRILMAAVPVNDAIAAAIARVSDLSQYSTAALRNAREWAVTINPTRDVGGLQQRLGAAQFRPSGLIDDVYLASFPAYRTGQSIARGIETYNPGLAAWPLVADQVATRFVPNDPSFPSQWHLQNTGQGGGTPGADANVVTAWEQYKGDGVVIGIVDDGVAPAHPDLAPNFRADLSWITSATTPIPAAGRTA
jgi:subtilisin family serine protease